MSKEALYIPEESLDKFIILLRYGIDKYEQIFPEDKEIISYLDKWCDEEEEYLQDLLND